MATISLSTYSLRVKQKNNDNFLRLNNLNGKYDFIKIFLNYLRKLKNTSHDISTKRLMQCNRFHLDSRLINGIIETGEYGYESDLLNVNKKRVSYRRKIDDAEILPFYFLLDVPQNKNEGILILQRFKQFGIRKFLRDDFKTYFNSLFSDLTIEIDPLVPYDLPEELIKKGIIQKIRLINFKLPVDIANYYDNGEDHYEEDGYMEIVFAAKRNKKLPIKNRVLGFLNKKDTTDFIQLRNYEYQDVKIEVKTNNTKRTISLNKFGNVNPTFDITNTVELTKTGHPVFDSIDKEAKILLDDIKNSIK